MAKCNSLRTHLRKAEPMKPLDRVRTVSRVFRYILIGTGSIIVIAVGVALLAAGQDGLSIGNEQLASLLQSGTISRAIAAALLAPIGLIFILGVYWLQRLFGAYAAGRFFTDESMTCYLWLVWLKVASFAYQLVLPLIITWLAMPASKADSDVIIDVSSLVELMVLLLIVHILREAQRINDENESFV